MEDLHNTPSTRPPTGGNHRGDVFAQLTPLVYQQLRRLGRRFMNRERGGHTLQPTALVNEALSKLVNSANASPDNELQFNDEQHFMAVCARQMRHILLDHAKARRRNKRKGIEQQGELSEEDSPITSGGFDLLELDETLKQLEQLEPDAAQVFELYYFGGHRLPAIGKLLGVAEITAQRRLRFARAWLLNQLNPPPRS